ncbi:Serpentine type 7TM GPCR chemoreceptor Srx family protein [Brugia pahangi]
MGGYNHFDDSIAMICIAMVWLFGFVSNGLSLYITRTRSHFRNAFGILCSSFLICNLQSISVLFTWCTIVLALKSPILSSSELFLARLVGVLVNGPYYGTLLIHFFVALNRLCAVLYPIRYKQLWSESRSLIVGIISWTTGTSLCMLHLYKDCSLLFNENSSYRFFYGDSYYGKVCGNADAALSVFIVMIMACLDSITLIKLLAYRRALRKNVTMSTGSAFNKKEVLFFKQSCLVSFIYTASVAVLITHPFLFTNKWLLFLSSTIIWILMQSTDGLVLLIFNFKMIWKTNSWVPTSTIAPATTIHRLHTITRH